MEFKSLTNIESSFRRIRMMAAVFICCCTLVTGYALWSSYRFAERQREKIYVLDGGKSLMMALSQDLSQNRPAEAREHVRRFHELFFSLSPQKEAISHNIDRALQLADKSAYHYYVDFAEKGYYNRLISGNINQVVHVDSVVCDFARYPYKARTYARQMIIRESNVTERSLVTTCSLQNTGRSDDNPNGFIIEQFTILENRDIRSTERREKKKTPETYGLLYPAVLPPPDKETTEDRDNHGIPLVSDGLPPCHPRLAIRLGRAWGKDENRICPAA